jgi:LCP family protein required for cell wall assembly
MKSKIIEVGSAVILALLSVFAIIAFISYKKVEKTIGIMQKIDKQEVKEMTNPNISNEVVSILKENWTIALFGLDSRDMENLSGSNSDVIILASVNNRTGVINLISVYRDTCLKTGDNRYRKVNEAYAIGGPKKAVEVLNENLDLQIDDYVAVNWKAVATMINMLGGVDIELTNDELKYINGYITETVKNTGIGSVQIYGEGMHHIDGVQAVAYSRIRYTSGNDYKRTERQRTVLTAVLSKAKATNWKTLNNVINSVFPMTASSIDTEDVIEVATNIAKYKLVKTGGFPFDKIEKTVNNQDFVFPNTLEKDVSKLHEFLYEVQSYEPSNMVKEISTAIDNKQNGNNKLSIKKENRVAIAETTVIPEIISQIEVKPEAAETISETKKEDSKSGNKNEENYGPGLVIVNETEVDQTELETESASTGNGSDTNE